MIEYLTTGVIVLLLYAAVIGVLILIGGGEDELLSEKDVDEGDGKALPYKINPQTNCYQLDGDCGRCCCRDYCDAIVGEGAGTHHGSTGSTEGQG